MSDDLEIRCEAQERRILELRAKLAEAEKRVAQQQVYILRLERREAIARAKAGTPRSKAERLFNA